MKPRSLLFLAACASLVSLSAHAQIYELQGRQQKGQGLARPRGPGDCLIVAPLHVVADSLSTIMATGETGTPLEVRVVRTYDRADVAILRLAAARASACPAWDVPSDLSARLSDASVSAVLRVRSGDAITSMPVWIRRVDGEYVTVVPRLPDDHFTAGMSGGQLLVNGVFAGMLLSTERVDKRRGAAPEAVRVLRSDVLDRLVSGAFSGPPVEGPGNRPPAPLGTASRESDLVMRAGETVILGDRNTAFGVHIVYSGGGLIDVTVNGERSGMGPGSRISFPDSRGECFIVFLRSEDDDRRQVFAIRCNPR